MSLDNHKRRNFDMMNFEKPLKLLVIGKKMQTISLNAHTLSMTFLPEKS